jgi:hypothetical protein
MKAAVQRIGANLRRCDGRREDPEDESNGKSSRRRRTPVRLLTLVIHLVRSPYIAVLVQSRGALRRLPTGSRESEFGGHCRTLAHSGPYCPVARIGSALTRVDQPEPTVAPAPNLAHVRAWRPRSGDPG